MTRVETVRRAGGAAAERVIAEPDARQVDASDLGPEVTLTLLERAPPEVDPGDALRRLDLALALTAAGAGTAAVVIELGFALVPAAGCPLAPGEVRPLPPLVPPRPFDTHDAAALLPHDGPLLHLHHRGDPEDLADDVAIAQVGDELVVWWAPTLDGEAEEWHEQSRVRLAPGVRIVAR